MKGKRGWGRGGHIHLGAQTFTGKVAPEWPHKSPAVPGSIPPPARLPRRPPAGPAAPVGEEDNGLHYRQAR